MSFAMPGPSRNPVPRNLQGTRPGLLDPTQPERVLRVPGSTLSFAAFDPLAASGSGTHARKRAHDPDPARPRRIVIETPPGSRGSGKWRFVPRARRAQGVEDEGPWPRRVVVCDEPVIMSEDQWDIYKLDPAYDCYVPEHPKSPIICRKDPHHVSDLHSRAGTPLGQFQKRRRRSSPSETEEHPPGLNKKFRTVVSLVTDEEGTDIEEATDSDEEDEVEEIMVEEFGRKPPSQFGREKRRRREAAQERAKERREKNNAKMSSSFEEARSKTPEIVDLTMEDITPPGSTAPNGVPPPGPTKRKIFTGAESPEDTSPAHGSQHEPNKRARTLSPGAANAEYNRRRTERGRRRTRQTKGHSDGLAEASGNSLWNTIFEGVPLPHPFPPPTSQSNGVNGDHQGDAGGGPQPTGNDAEHETAIEESRRKLAELERDRPLWEQEARKRAARQQAEEDALRAQKEAERRRAALAAAEEEQRRRRAEAAAAEAEHRLRAEKARREREREQRRQRERERWSYGPWTTIRAIEHYKVLSEAFDAARFTADNPIDFEMVPWPVLHSPVTLRVEDIDWASVEAFFEAAGRHMRAQDYKTFVEKSHKRFHPDRWRARGVLKSLPDEELRGNLEVAANTVAQALTPIWREMRG